MRFLHTSDWHLGRTLHGESLLSAQREFLTWLVETAELRDVHAVLVAGDVYDRAVPSTDAVELLDDVLTAMAEVGRVVVLTSGNHDSAIRLGFGRSLHRRAGVHVRTRVADLVDPVVLADEHGDVAIYGIPYLLPDAVMAELSAERSHASVLRAAVERILADAGGRGIDRVVALAHAFVTGGAPSDSERDIRVGGIGDAPAAVFDGLSYAALGHLHGRQRLADHVAYSGSPIAFSFSERRHTKSVSLVEVDDAGRVSVEYVPVPVPRPLREVRGRLDDLLRRADTDLSDVGDAWVKAVLTDVTRPHAPMERLREKWPYTLVLDFQPEWAESADAGLDRSAQVGDGADPIEICAAFVEWVDSTRPSHAQRDALQSVVDAVVRAELSA
jgi:exonuclease SbcD